MIRRIPSVFLLCFLLLHFCISTGYTEHFGDIENHQAKQDIEILNNRGILGGYPDGTFRPEGLVSRAEFASMIVRGTGRKISPSPKTPSFGDVLPKHWAFPYVEAARSYGLISGTPAGNYLPDDYITRLDVMVMLAKAANLPIPSEATARQILATFIDGSDVPQWAKPYIAAIIQQGIFANYPNNKLIEPSLSASRATVAMMTRRALFPKHADDDIAWQAGPSSKNSQIHVPAQREFAVTLTQSLSSEMNRLGDIIIVELSEALSAEIPASSQIEGHIAKIIPAGPSSRQGAIKLDFDQLRLPNGDNLPIKAQLASSGNLLQGQSPQTTPQSEEGVPVSLRKGDTLRLRLVTPIILPKGSP